MLSQDELKERQAILDWLKSLEAVVKYGVAISRHDGEMIRRTAAHIAAQPPAWDEAVEAAAVLAKSRWNTSGHELAQEILSLRRPTPAAASVGEDVKRTSAPPKDGPHDHVFWWPDGIISKEAVCKHCGLTRDALRTVTARG